MRFSLFPLFALTLAAQTPSFEVAALHPAKSVGTTSPSICGNLNLNPENVIGAEGLLHSGVHTLAALIESAYHDEVDDFDFPVWTRAYSSGRVAVSVKIPPGTTFRMCRKMLQNLLAERYHMVTGIEIREVSRYYVKVAKSGLKLKTVAPAADPNTDFRISVEDGLQRFEFRGASASRVFRVVESAALMDARFRAVDPLYADFQIAEVVDETGLTGNYDGGFQFTLPRPNQSPEPESLKDALERQLGLTLELRKAPGRVLVIRSSDCTPTEN